MSKSRNTKLGLVALALTLSLPAFAGGHKEVKIEPKNCPDAVSRTIRKEAGNGRILEIEKETRKCGAVVYEAEVKKNDGVRIEVKVAPCGKLLGVEVEDEVGEKDHGKGKAHCKK
jgi:hypothetical protein